jgi:hypothetical protein
LTVRLHTWRFSRPSLPGASKASDNPRASEAPRSRPAASSGKALAVTALTIRRRVDTRVKVYKNRVMNIVNEEKIERLTFMFSK